MNREKLFRALIPGVPGIGRRSLLRFNGDYWMSL
jgi:hypothetical protein